MVYCGEELEMAQSLEEMKVRAVTRFLHLKGNNSKGNYAEVRAVHGEIPQRMTLWVSGTDASGVG